MRSAFRRLKGNRIDIKNNPANVPGRAHCLQSVYMFKSKKVTSHLLLPYMGRKKAGERKTSTLSAFNTLDKGKSIL
jgi:hypothetical protein